MKPSQFFAMIVGRERCISLDRELSITGVQKSPSFIRVNIAADSGLLIFQPEKTGRGILTLKTKTGMLSIRLSVFSEKEAFLITALSCNYHTGWNPSLQNNLPHHLCCGSDKSGNAFVHVTRMERILHDCNLPITWFIDPPTAREQTDYFRNGCRQNGDEIAFMPSSFSHFNPVNYNIEKTYEETLELLRNGISSLEEIFQRRVTTVAIDQFIGSIGTNFTNAASALGMNALWGMGFDHYTCDTSMFHGGCPWNPYRPDITNFRTPGRNPRPIWIFQWTFRDLINTVHVPGGASGAVMFSTDVDDILCTSIARHQDDYYHRIASEFLKNKNFNDMLVTTIHQEDHDSWTEDGCAYYERFFSSLPEGFTPATMGEVAEWLDLKYPTPAESRQVLRLEDPLTCKDDVNFLHPDVKKPPDWPVGGAPYPPHIFYYDSDFQMVFLEKSHTPLRFIDYRKKYPVPEKGYYPHEVLPRITIHSFKISQDGISYDIDSDGDYPDYPIAAWTDIKPPKDVILIPGGFITFLSLQKGNNSGMLCWK
jgi:hypothetical protein